MLLKVGSRVLLVALTFVLIITLANIALTAASTRLDRMPLGEVLGRGLEATRDYFADLFAGSLGEASSTSILGGRRRAMGEVVLDAYPKSLALVALAVGLASAAGIACGVAAAATRSARLRGALLGSSILAISIPSYLLAVLGLLLSAEAVRRFGFRLWPSFGFGWDDHLILPVLVLGARPFAQVANITYVAVDEILRQDHIRTARAKGLLESLILSRHALPNAMVPVLGAISVAVSVALSSLPVVEVFFSWPGLGLALLQSIRRFDAATAGTLLGALAVTIAIVRFSLDALAARYQRAATGARA